MSSISYVFFGVLLLDYLPFSVPSNMTTIAPTPWWQGQQNFRGGFISWKQSTNGSQGGNISLDFHFRISYRKSAGYSCNASTVANKVRYTSFVNQAWNVSTYYSTWYNPRSREYYCMDYNDVDDWVVIGNSFSYVLPGNGSFIIWYYGCCWIHGPSPHPLNIRLSFNVFGTFNSSTRSDTGRINSSPFTDMPLTVNLVLGVSDTISFNVTDPDGDRVRCRNQRYYVTFPYGLLVKDNCTLTYNGQGRAGLYAIALVLEDYPAWVRDFNSTIAISSTTLQFLLKINDTGTTTTAPSSSPSPSSSPTQATTQASTGSSGTRRVFITKRESATVSLHCPATAPVSSGNIHWSKDPGPMSDRVTIRSDNVLVIKNITAEDAGRYVCTAGDNTGIIHLGVTLSVATDFALRILNWNYTEAYTNKSSQEYITFEKNFTAEMDKVYAGILGYEGTEILNISYGSLRVKFRVKVKYTVNSSSESTAHIKVVLTNKIIVRAKTGYVESFQVDRSSGALQSSSPPPAPRDAKVREVTSDGAIIEWLAPADDEYYHITGYRVKYWQHATSDNDITSNIGGNNFQLTGLEQDKQFNAHVFAVNKHGDGVNSENFSFKTKGESLAVWLIVAIVVVVVITGFVIALIIIYFCCRQKHDMQKGQHELDGKNVEMNKIEAGEPKLLRIYHNLAMQEDLIPCKLFQRKDLQLLQELGSGEFGVVVKGELFREDGKTLEECAVKTIKGSAGPDELRAFHQELDIMCHVGYHPNLINLIGACTDEGQLLVIVEYAGDGCLLDLLKQQRGGSDELRLYQNIPTERSKQFVLSDSTKVEIMLDVARGMEYLASKRCVHRDLAARNVLIADGVAKVADFGLSRDIYETGEYEKTTTGKLPTKWMALESLETRKFTLKSDVWSYGVLLWEIETKGLLPFSGLDYRSIISVLKSGRRLDRPPGCPDEIYQVMTSCWLVKPKNRPTFSQLCDSLTVQLTKEKLYGPSMA